MKDCDLNDRIQDYRSKNTKQDTRKFPKLQRAMQES